MPAPLTDATVFLINTLLQFLLYVLAMRLLLVYAHASRQNPVVNIIFKITQPFINLFHRFLPTIGGIELPTLIFIILFCILKFVLLGLLSYGVPGVLGLIVISLGDAIRVLVNTLFYGIFLQVILSWIQPGYNPVTEMLTKMNSPLMRPLEKIIPTVGGINIAPIPALILLQLVLILVANPIIRYGALLG